MANDDLIQRLDSIRERAADRTKALATAQHASTDPDLALICYDLSALDMPSSLKSDMASMEAPLFSLSTQPDLQEWTWASVDGKKTVKVRGDATYGRATQHDKDILLYCLGKIAKARQAGLSPSRTVKFFARDFLIATSRGTRADDYERLDDSLRRLQGTTIETNIRPDRTKGQFREMRTFGLIEHGRRTADKNRTVIEITLSPWLWDASLSNNLLTLSQDYLLLRKPLARRLYEIGRKHCGKQKTFSIKLENLMPKCGIRNSSPRTLRDFKASITSIIQEGNMPDMTLTLDEQGIVHFTANEAVDNPD